MHIYIYIYVYTYRAPLQPCRLREGFIGVCMLHAFADGNCYLPLVKARLFMAGWEVWLWP